jgi:hypothetical protein
VNNIMNDPASTSAQMSPVPSAAPSFEAIVIVPGPITTAAVIIPGPN